MSDVTVVIVEDDFLIAEDLRGMCEEFGVKVLGMAHTAATAFAEIETHRPQFVLMDVRLGGKRDGVDIAQQVNDVMPEVKLVFITGSNEPPTIERIKEDHPFRILIKPISPEQLGEALSA